MQLHNLQRNTSHKTAKRVGRGGKRGKTSGRGHKGQKSRAGGSPRPEMRDIIAKLPKRRGYNRNRARTVNANKAKAFPINVGTLESMFEAGATITPKTLSAKKLIPSRGGRLSPVKILGHGALTKKLTLSGVSVSKSAKEKIEKAKGEIAS